MDIKDEKIDLTPNQLKFSGASGEKKYEANIEFFADVVPEDSKWTKTGFHLFFVLSKKAQDEAFWPRVTKEKVKNQYISVDWAKWVDEDEEEEDPNKGLGGFDPNAMQSTPYLT